MAELRAHPAEAERRSVGRQAHLRHRCRTACETWRREVADVAAAGVEVGVVVGGGNIFRGVAAAAQKHGPRHRRPHGHAGHGDQFTGPEDALEQMGIPTRVMSAIEMHQVAEPYIRRRAIRHLEKGRIVIFAAGTSNPYFSTDTAATLRALEIKAEVIAKATRVDGVYDKDPLKFPDAVMFRRNLLPGSTVAAPWA